MSSSGVQSMGSNNPFRRKLAVTSANPATSSSPRASLSLSLDSAFGVEGAAVSPTTTTTTQPPSTTFRIAVAENEQPGEHEEPVQQKPKKIIKKVRVQSPPPSSPEEPESAEDAEEASPTARFPSLSQLHGNHDSSKEDNGDKDDDDDDDDDDDSASDSSNSNDDAGDPFSPTSGAQGSKLASEAVLPPIPPNPFARTLQDIEGTGPARDANIAATAAAAAGNTRASLDVDSFKRLLLTGYANLPNPGPAVPETLGRPSVATHSLGSQLDGASVTDTSSMSKQSSLDVVRETPRTSHEISESEASEDRKGVFASSPLATVPSALARKKPPPPSSRHGKLIKMELGADSTSPPALASPPGQALRKASSESATPLRSLQGTTNVNKPLPAPPIRASAEEDVESPFDREAAGKVPEGFVELPVHHRPPTPPPATRSRSGSQTSTQSRKPAAPPPRRHGRSESKVPPVYPNNTEEDPPRSSMESSRSRTESLRIGVNSEKLSYAPAPPPPRRPSHIRHGSSFASANSGGFSSTINPGLNEKERSPLGSSFTPIISPGLALGRSLSISSAAAGPNGQTKNSPPPPPPTRKQSMRRPPSVRSMESSSSLAPMRRVSKEKDGPPPPPPPRSRNWGTGLPSPDSPALGEEAPRKGSMGSVSAGNGSATPTTVKSGKQGEEILADLNALQREVDALMKKATN
ncbi:hypothetical protein F5Y14DRAFT_264702 [Nemania sp. NC0429]|nr:hypothetical protein F5Y14DRAFT_264702 [Nemania sp. NC0429]